MSRCSAKELKACVGRRVVSLYNFGAETEAEYLNVPKGSKGTVVGYYTDYDGGLYIRWDPPAKWGEDNGENSHWGVPKELPGSRGHFEFYVTHRCANCDVGIDEDDYLCKGCRQ